ncbi:dual specificity protein phosphatase 22-B-like isoform X2 [Ptychodera flava]|uniref:dual specificity protein phosphatase 22-B-like isoform X2 n=1 Tax=Ptychodera flava TaxID=63121 RepID=UPI00396A6FE2
MKSVEKILPGLYVGNFKDCKDREQLTANKITHIVSIHDNAKPLIDDMKYLCIYVGDSPQQNLSQYFRRCIKFIHEARLNGGAVLVHCLAGMSRSVTVTVAYIMTVSEYGWQDSLRAVKSARPVALPNFGFQRQLQQYEHTTLKKERAQLKATYPNSTFDDNASVAALLESYAQKEGIEKDLYPLPYKAYGERATKEKEKH